MYFKIKKILNMQGMCVLNRKNDTAERQTQQNDTAEPHSKRLNNDTATNKNNNWSVLISIFF